MSPQTTSHGTVDAVAEWLAEKRADAIWNHLTA
jgi:hypothetical protein